MKNPIMTRNDDLDWWYEQATDILRVDIVSISAGARTFLRTDKRKTVGSLTIGYDDLKNFTGAPAGRWALARLDRDPAGGGGSPMLHFLFAVIWILLLILGLTGVTSSFATSLPFFLGGVFLAGAHFLYIRSTATRRAHDVLLADQGASLDIGLGAAREWFDHAIDGLYRTPVHALREKRSPVSLRNRATALGLEVTTIGEVSLP